MFLIRSLRIMGVFVGFLALVGCEAGGKADRMGFLASKRLSSVNRNLSAQALSPTEMIKHLTRRFGKDVIPSINFDYNSARLTSDARVILRGQALWMKAHPDLRFKIYGHTDKVGSDAYNKRLGQRRANAALAFLLQEGIPKSRIDAVVSFGETRPLVFTEEENATNRRTVTEVSEFTRKANAQTDGKHTRDIYRRYIGGFNTQNADSSGF